MASSCLLVVYVVSTLVIVNICVKHLTRKDFAKGPAGPDSQVHSICTHGMYWSVPIKAVRCAAAAAAHHDGDGEP